jgi:hypothetical protein
MDAVASYDSPSPASSPRNASGEPKLGLFRGDLLDLPRRFDESVLPGAGAERGAEGGAEGGAEEGAEGVPRSAQVTVLPAPILAAVK